MSSTNAASDGPSTSTEPAVPFFRKKKAPAKARPTALRKRAASDDDNDDARGEPAVIKAERKTAYNPLNQSTGVSKRRRKLTGEDESSDEGNEDVGVKYSEKTMARRRSRSRSKSPSRTDGKDKTETAASSGAGPNDGLYHGTASYGSQLPKGGARFGPVKGPDNVRTITLVDYQPDVCKDYKGEYPGLAMQHEEPVLTSVAPLRNGILWIRRHLQILA
jgi:RING finger protein 113A